MSIANSTLHFHFPLVVGTDRPLFEDYNQAMEDIDKKLYESISTLETIPQEITDLQTAVNGIAEQIAALETFKTEQTGTNQLVNNAILALQQATAIIPTKYDSAGIADPYDADHGTYIVGDVVTYNGQRYECSQAVTAAEPFDADKWTAVDVQQVLTYLKNLIRPLVFEKADTQQGSYYSMSFKRRGHITSCDGTMNLATSYPANTDLIDIADTDFRPTMGQPVLLYNQTDNTARLAYFSTSGKITAVTAFTAGNYIIGVTYMT